MAEMAPANMVSTLDQVKMIVPHCPGYGNLQATIGTHSRGDASRMEMQPPSVQMRNCADIVLVHVIRLPRVLRVT